MRLADKLYLVVPGTDLREGLNRILKARMGALLVLDDSKEILNIASGGFHIDATMTPQRLSELAKMDGAIILDKAAKRILWANIHLMPDPAAFTTETGTRHRTAERVARSTDAFVVSVSEEMGSITLYFRDEKKLLEPTENIGIRFNRMMQVLERQFRRINATENDVSQHGHGDKLAKNILLFFQQIQVFDRVANEIEGLLDELGTLGRFQYFELDDMKTNLAESKKAMAKRYLELIESYSPEELLETFGEMKDSSLSDFLALDDTLNSSDSAGEIQ